MAVSQKLSDLAKKIGNDALLDIGDALVPALMDELNLVLPAGLAPYESAIEEVLEPALQTALSTVLGKIKL